MDNPALAINRKHAPVILIDGVSMNRFFVRKKEAEQKETKKRKLGGETVGVPPSGGQEKAG
jgi:hypothetical protein